MTGDHASTGKPHMLTDLNCHGHENSLFDCQFTTLVDSSPCTNGNSAAVICDIGKCLFIYLKHADIIII